MKRNNFHSIKYSVGWRALCETWNIFSQNTSIHGLKFITDPQGNVTTKSIWALVTFFSFLVANLFVNTFYKAFISNPTRMNIETEFAVLPEIEFPAATICPSSFISYVKSKEFVDTLKLPPNITQQMVMAYVAQTTGFRLKTYYNEADMNQLQRIATLNRYDIEQFMSMIRATCEEYIFRCRFESEIVNCMDVFTRSHSYSGYCCSFNINQAGTKYLEKQAHYHGLNRGLSVLIKADIDDHPASDVYSSAYKLLIHDPRFFPSDTTVEKMIPIGHEVMVRMKPTEISCSDEVRQMPAEDRQCLLEDEQKLVFFEAYDDQNCDIECQILAIQKSCNCMPYYFMNKNRSPTCNFTKIPCLVDNFDDARSKHSNLTKGCLCLGSCKRLMWEMQTNVIPLSIDNITIDPFYQNIDESFIGLHIYIPSQTFKRLRRELLVDIISLIANLGGIYSLFVGMSVISVVEALYFATVIYMRNYFAIKRDDQRALVFTRQLEKMRFQAIKRNTTRQSNHMDYKRNFRHPLTSKIP